MLPNVLPDGQITYSPTSGLALELDSQWVNNYGYRPIRLTVRSATPVPADQLITIQLRPEWWFSISGSVEVEHQFVLPKGRTSATTTFACPQYALSIQYFWWDVWVDGVNDENLSLKSVTAMTTWNGQSIPGSYSNLTVATVESGLPEPKGAANDETDVELVDLGIEELPTTWIEYSCLDVVSLTYEKLAELAADRPDALTALRRWTAAGGQLWILEIGDQWQRLPELNEMLALRSEAGVPTREDSADSIEEETARSGWKPTRFNQLTLRSTPREFIEISTGARVAAEDADALERMIADSDYVPVATMLAEKAEVETETIEEQFTPEAWRLWSIRRPLGFGYVCAMQDSWNLDEMRDGILALRISKIPDPSEPNAALAAMLSATSGWAKRHGLYPDTSSNEFTNFLIPGIGTAPLVEFRVLITLFVLVIGPLNYWILKRTDRVYLLVLTVPLAAGLTTAALFAYVLLSDGVGTTVRVRSYTKLDQQTGETVCWSRQSYYAGMMPAEGMTIPSDVTLYPIASDWISWRSEGWDHSRSSMPGLNKLPLIWENDSAHLMSGWLRSRTPMQYLLLRSRVSPHRVELRSLPNSMALKNQLGTRIEFIVATDEENRLFWGESIDYEATARLIPTERPEVLRRLRELVIDNHPTLPPEMASPEESVFDASRSEFRSFGNPYDRVEIVRLRNNRLNQAIDDLVGLRGFKPLDLPVRSYLAVTAEGPEVVLGVAGAEEQASFHLVEGQW